MLERAFAKRMAKLIQIKKKPEEWTDRELLSALAEFGANLPGNFILGDGPALENCQALKIAIAKGDCRKSIPEVFPEYAERALEEDDVYGSSAGGEQPKFTTMVSSTPEEAPRAVIVKFSPRDTSLTGRRWADLLYAEHIANEVLGEVGFATAQTRTFYLDKRVFLESERFDRVGPTGRRGLVSLRALDAAHPGLGQGHWAKAARLLHAGKWFTVEDCGCMIRLHCFGELIANTDMHWGNLSYFLPEQSPYPLAPVHDMLPKREDQGAWLEMHPHALIFWQRITEHPEISFDFKGIANDAIQSLKRIHKIATS